MKKMKKRLLMTILLSICFTFSTMITHAEEMTDSEPNVISEVQGDGQTEDDIPDTDVPSGSDNESDDVNQPEDSETEKDTETEEQPEAPKYTGWVEKSEGWYYYDANGNLVTGWKQSKGIWYYLNGEDVEYPGRMATGCELKINGSVYRFDAAGAMITGWFKDTNNQWYYYTTSGTRLEGEWLQSKGVWYYFISEYEDADRAGMMAAGEELLVSDGERYLFAASGAMQKGWHNTSEGWYYYETTGAKSVGEWQRIKNIWYYFMSAEENTECPGLMAANGEWTIDGSTYLFAASGAMHKGWIEKSEGWYYYTISGAKAEAGWYTIGTKKYYFLSAEESPEYPGLMYDNASIEIDGLTYYFNEDGSLVTGWLEEDGKWFYLDSNGQKTSGWVKAAGKWYYLNPENQEMISSDWLYENGTYYYLKSSGAMATGWEKIGGYWYYFSNSGAMLSGWQKIGGNWYYLYTENDANGGPYGAMAAGKNIDGYWLDASGKMVTPQQTLMNQKAQAYSSSTNYLILVNRSTHKVGIYQGSKGKWNCIKYWDCSDGAPSTPTVEGVFRVGAKGYYFDSGAARCYWYTQFYGDYLFHSTLYTHSGVPSDSRLGMALSHGCVRLAIENAKWIYDNIPTNTTVVVYH